MTEGHGDDIYRYGNIDYNFSSNIYGAADLSALEQYLCQHIDTIRHYPDPTPARLEAALARYHGIDTAEVMVTNGATEAIYLIAQAYRPLAGTYTVYHPTFSEYGDASHAMRYVAADHGHLAWICCPNNPTGEVLTIEQLQDMARRSRWLVIDQSYEDYTLRPVPTAAQALAMGNVMQLHSMTKRYAVPGLRLGYITAPAPLLAPLRSLTRPWAIGALPLLAGEWLVEHGTPAVPDKEAYLAESQRMQQRLAQVEGLTVQPSDTNFCLCALHRHNAASLKEYLATKHRMLIRDASNFPTLTPRHFRVAALTPEADDALAEAITQFIEQDR